MAAFSILPGFKLFQVCRYFLYGSGWFVSDALGHIGTFALCGVILNNRSANIAQQGNHLPEGKEQNAGNGDCQGNDQELKPTIGETDQH